MGDMTLDLTPRGAASIEALVNGPIQTNSYAVISNDECLIVDPAWEGERLVEHIRTAHPEAMLVTGANTLRRYEAGAVILPASPSFYAAPQGIEELCGTVADRTVALLGVDIPRYEWGK